MSVVDTTQVTVKGQQSSAAAAPAPSVADANPPADGGSGAAKSSDGTRPEANDLINSILDKHGLSSPEELAEFLDLGAETLSQIGDYDAEELVKAKTTLDAYQKEWSRQEQERLKANETPEQTIARLEKEANERENKAAIRDRQRRQAEAAKKAVAAYNQTINAAIAAEKDLPAEYVPFIREFCGVGSPVPEVNIQDRVAVKNVAKLGVKRARDFAQVVIKAYREGKEVIPDVPTSTENAAPVVDEHKPKNLTEARVTLRDRITQQLLGRK
jgi:hypothetical protein